VNDPIQHLGDLFRQLAQEVVAAVNADINANGWTDVLLDIRYSPESSTQLRKVRATVAGSVVSINSAYGRLPILTLLLRKENRLDAFYGVLMKVTANGEVDIRLNYDPKHYSSPDFAAT
jgi:hypothetical protein